MFLFGSSYCPANYTCLSNLGENPNFGYTNFDNFGWAMLNSFQLITLDFWEDIYNKVSAIVFNSHTTDVYLCFVLKGSCQYFLARLLKESFPFTFIVKSCNTV